MFVTRILWNILGLDLRPSLRKWYLPNCFLKVRCLKNKFFFNLQLKILKTHLIFFFYSVISLNIFWNSEEYSLLIYYVLLEVDATLVSIFMCL